MNLKEFARDFVKEAWTAGKSAKAVYSGINRRAGNWAMGLGKKEPRQTLRSVEHIAKKRPEVLRRVEELHKNEIKRFGSGASDAPYLDKMKKEYT